MNREYKENFMLFTLEREKYNRITTKWVGWEPYEDRENNTFRHRDVSFFPYKEIPMADKEVIVTYEDGEEPETDPKLIEVVKKYIPTYTYTEYGQEEKIGVSAMYNILSVQFDEENRASLLNIELFESFYYIDNGRAAYEDFGIMYPQEVVEELMSKHFGFDGIDLRDIMPSYDAVQQAYKGSEGGYGGGGGYYAIFTGIEQKGEYTVFDYDIYYSYMADTPNTTHLSNQATLVLKVDDDGNYEYISNEYYLEYPITMS